LIEGAGGSDYPIASGPLPESPRRSRRRTGHDHESPEDQPALHAFVPLLDEALRSRRVVSKGADHGRERVHCFELSPVSFCR
jgi:hypothetical protein